MFCTLNVNACIRQIVYRFMFLCHYEFNFFVLFYFDLFISSVCLCIPFLIFILCSMPCLQYCCCDENIPKLGSIKSILFQPTSVECQLVKLLQNKLIYMLFNFKQHVFKESKIIFEKLHQKVCQSVQQLKYSGKYCAGVLLSYSIE